MASEAELSWQVLLEHSTPFCADCVERCPQREGVLVVGTYQLDEETRERQGGFQVAHVREQDSDAAAPQVSIGDFVASDGVLDAKWSCAAEDGGVLPTLASATAGGCVELYQLKEMSLSLQHTSERLVDEDGSMALSLDWSNRRSRDTSAKVAVSTTHSSVHVLEMGEGGMEEVSSWRAHEFFGGMDIQVWIVAFNAWDSNSLLTGGDDCKLKAFDLRTGATPTWVSSAHSEGVCSAQWHAELEHTFATGSYDGTVALWDARNRKTPLAQQAQGGGVWRIKWHPAHPNLMATASMRGGFHVIDWELAKESSAASAEVKSERVYWGHTPKCEEKQIDHLAYGVDWVLPAGGSAWAVGSASFYDASFHVWSSAAGQL